MYKKEECITERTYLLPIGSVVDECFIPNNLKKYFKECDGSRIDDPDSEIHGFVVPVAPGLYMKIKHYAVVQKPKVFVRANNLTDYFKEKEEELNEILEDTNTQCECGATKCGSPMHSDWCPRKKYDND